MQGLVFPFGVEYHIVREKSFYRIIALSTNGKIALTYCGGSAFMISWAYMTYSYGVE
jgi:hypothetical protein